MDIDTVNHIQDNVDDTVVQQHPQTNVPSGQVFIKTLTGQSIAIDYRSDLTIEEVKETINSRDGIPVNQQRLIYQGKQLDNDQTLSDYNIQENSTIHLVLQVKGGESYDYM